MTPRRIAEFAIGPVGAALLGFATLPVITWLFDQGDVGRVAMLQVGINFFVLIFALGLDQAYVREYHTSAERASLLKTVVLPGGALIIISLALLMIRPTLIADTLFGGGGAVLSALAAACVLSAFFSRFLSLILRMQERGLAFSASQVLPKVVLLGVLAVYFVAPGTDELGDLVLAQTIAICSTMLLLASMTRGEWGPALNARFDRSEFGSMLGYGAPLIAGGVAYWGLTAIDKISLRALSTFSELGVYSVSVSFSAAAMILQSVFSTVWAPMVYKWVSAGGGVEKVKPVARYMLIAVLVLFSLAGSLSWLVDIVLPASYGAVKYILLPCLGYPLFYTLSEATKVGIGISRKTRYSMIASIVAFLVNVIANLILIPDFGAAGAAVSTAFAFWVFLVLRTEFSNRLWMRLPRAEMYVYTLAVLSLATITALLGSRGGPLIHMIWLLVLLLVVARYRRDLIAASMWIRRLRRSDGTRTS